MSVTVEHFAYGTDDGFVSVGIAVRHRQAPGGDTRMDFVAEVDLAKGEVKDRVEALRTTCYANFEKAQDDGGYIDVIKELHEGAWIEWHDKEGREVREPFSFGWDGWSERFAEDIDRAIGEASRCRRTTSPATVETILKALRK